ncbi:RNase H domain-containing protein [Trichonephila clavipes]|nr:RNase H domain-containing protein [Trichonephila clavipes]
MRCHSDGDHDDWLPHHSRRFHQCCGVKGRRLKGNCEPDPTSAKRREMVEELHSTYINNKQSTIPPAHHRYEAKRPGGSLFLQCSRQEQTILTRFQSGHLRALTFKDKNKVFPTCVRCSACQASPEHILDCLGLSKQDLYEDPLMVLDFLRVNGIMDLV